MKTVAHDSKDFRVVRPSWAVWDCSQGYNVIAEHHLSNMIGTPLIMASSTGSTLMNGNLTFFKRDARLA